jgi:formylglycine-generating enzyme required for sulfatase activity
VDNVRWTDAREFINRLNLLEKTNKYRLPTEAQWEYACRAGSTTAFANGDISDVECQDPVLNEIGWYCIEGPRPVGRKKPNAWGLHDMHGNVWEWCRDGYRDYTNESLVDPVVESDDRYRIYRGGSWYDAAAACRSAQRGWEHPESYNTHIGFRVISLD